MYKKLILAAGLLLAALSTTACNMVTVDPGNVGIKFDKFGGDGGVQHDTLQPRFYMLGINDVVYQYPTYTQTIQFCDHATNTESNNNSSSIQMETGAPVTFQSKDNATVSGCIGMNYHADPASIPSLFQHFRAQGALDNRPLEAIAHTWLRQKLADQINIEAAKYTAYELLPNRVKLLSDAFNTVRQQAAAVGIVIEQLSWLGPLQYPADVQRSINATLTATQDAERARQSLVAAQAQAQVTIANADAEARAIQVRAEAIARNPRVIEYMQAEAFKEHWNGQLPGVMTGNSGLMLNLAGNN